MRSHALAQVAAQLNFYFEQNVSALRYVLDGGCVCTALRKAPRKYDWAAQVETRHIRRRSQPPSPRKSVGGGATRDLDALETNKT